MTTFQTIICLVILAVLVGAYMFYQAYKAKNTKIEFTLENIKEMLSDLGASDVSFPEEGGVLFQTEYNKIF